MGASVKWAVGAAAGVAAGLLVGSAFAGGQETTAAGGGGGRQVAAPASLDVECVITQGVPVGLDADQARNARVIIRAARAAGAGEAGARIGVATALVEGVFTRGENTGRVSGLRNVPYGDRDSLGLFQQRPSQGWGTREQIMNPTYSAAAFFRALGRVDGWRRMDPGAAAQAVQRSAFPARYARRMDEAARIVAALGGGSTGCTNVASTDTNVAVNVRPVIAWAITQMGKPYVFGANGPDAWDCSSFSQRAFRQIGITMPRTAQAQRDWCASGKCGRIPLGKERPGDLIFWNSYLGPTQIGHVMIVKNADTKMTLEAHRTCRAGDTQGKTCGTGSWSYAGITEKAIGEIWRVRQ